MYSASAVLSIAANQNREAVTTANVPTAQVAIAQAQRLERVAAPLCTSEEVIALVFIVIPLIVFSWFLVYMNLMHGKDTSPRPTVLPGMSLDDAVPLDFPLNIANPSKLTDWAEKG